MHDNRNWTVAVIRMQYHPRGKYYMKFGDVCKEVSKKTLQLPQGSIKRLCSFYILFLKEKIDWVGATTTKFGDKMRLESLKDCQWALN